MITAGIKHVRDKFTGYLKRVREGEEILLTERGKPIAVIKPLPKKDSLEEKLALLEARGLVKRPASWRPLKARHRPIRTKGKPLSQLIIEERRKGW